MTPLSVKDITDLFAAARAQGVIRFKIDTLEVHLDPGQPAVKRTKDATRRAPEPDNMIDLALSMKGHDGS